MLDQYANNTAVFKNKVREAIIYLRLFLDGFSLSEDILCYTAYL